MIGDHTSFRVGGAVPISGAGRYALGRPRSSVIVVHRSTEDERAALRIQSAAAVRAASWTGRAAADYKIAGRRLPGVRLLQTRTWLAALLGPAKTEELEVCVGAPLHGNAVYKFYKTVRLSGNPRKISLEQRQTVKFGLPGR